MGNGRRQRSVSVRNRRSFPGGLTGLLPRKVQLISTLQIHPEIRGHSEYWLRRSAVSAATFRFPAKS